MPLAHLVFKQAPVRKPRERVDIGDLLELALALTKLQAALFELRRPLGHEVLQLAAGVGTGMRCALAPTPRSAGRRKLPQ